MIWACLAREFETGKVKLVTSEVESIDLDRYERHTVPGTEEGDDLVFRGHTFTRLCPCRPFIEYDQNSEIVVHQELRPN